jgi:hypothetical protein
LEGAVLSVGSLLHSKHPPRKEPSEAREKASLRGKQGSSAGPDKSHDSESRLTVSGTGPRATRFMRRMGNNNESNVMTPIKKVTDLEGEPEPKTAFLLGLALGAILPLLVLATSSA